MTTATPLRRAVARLDRLPAAWVVVAAGFCLQVALALVVLGSAAANGNRVRLVVGAVLLAIVVVAGVAALPALVLLWRGRYERAGAALAALVGVATLVFNEGHPTVWPFAAALLVAAGRAWVGASFDAADLLTLDPDRFERVDSRAPGPDAADRDGPSSRENGSDRGRR